ncbi:sororin [Glossophaga mutica]
MRPGPAPVTPAVETGEERGSDRPHPPALRHFRFLAAGRVVRTSLPQERLALARVPAPAAAAAARRMSRPRPDMSERRTRSSGAARVSGPTAASPTKSLRRFQRKSDSDPPITLPEIRLKAPDAAPARKPIVLKKIVAHVVEVPSVHSPRRSPRLAFVLEKENNPPSKELTREDLFKTCSVPVTPNTTPVLCDPDVESDSREGDLDTRDLEMSKKVRRSYSRLETLRCASTSTPGRPSCFGFEGLLGTEDLAGVSPLVCSKSTEVTTVPVKPWAPDTTLPGISPPVKEKRKKKKVPEILKSELDEWAAAMNAEFEAAEQFDLLVE